jgi:GNAT superfamily N-acetyltransferase
MVARRRGPAQNDAESDAMDTQLVGGRPSALRCARCGRLVDWEHSRLQIVCGCRTHLDLPPVLVREATEEDRPRVRELFLAEFGHLTIVAFGSVMHAGDEPALVAEMRDDLAGALAYREMGDALHVVALATDPLWQRAGVGGYLLAEAELLARGKSLPRVIAATSNDNIPALYFYQRHGYRLTAIEPDAFAAQHVRATAPGFGGIAVHDEVRMEKRLVY